MRRMTAPTLSAANPARGLRGGGPGNVRTTGLAGRSTLDRPLPAPPVSAAPQSRQLSLEDQMPRWQPDQEVSECPICHIPFSFLRRKHHCRKCGRVVCGPCSPHRITIPQQYIVRPLEQQHVAQAIIDLTGDNDPNTSQQIRQSNPTLRAAEEVRLCNPCVPDPNPMPHGFGTPVGDAANGSSRLNPLAMPFPNQRSFNTSQGSSFPQASPVPQPPTHVFPTGQPYFDPRTLAALPPLPINDPRQLSASSGMVSNAAPSPYMFNRAANFPRATTEAHHRPHSSTNSINAGYFPRPIGSGYPAANIQPPPPQIHPRAHPQPQIAEEDECPICHQELPPKGPNGDETAREAHVNSCIESRLSSSTPSHSVGRGPLPMAATTVPPNAEPSSSTPAPNAINALSTSSGAPTATTHPMFQQQQQTRRRTSGMVTYYATEKDCIGSGSDGSDGKAQECIICFEEFEPGDEMGRLECLCKFHRKCIREWWETKGPGSCPVHQQQEGIY